jgi:predicted 3-demethylubiquinone-9 3-methyltransferase (glyoxalase superfamily)
VRGTRIAATDRNACSERSKQQAEPSRMRPPYLSKSQAVLRLEDSNEQLLKESLMPVTRKIAACLWFDDQAEEAATFYTSIFKNSKITKVSRYGEAGQEIHKRPPGSVMTVAFELDGQPFTALNGGPVFKFNEAISFQVNCETQEEVDYYWDKLSAGGDEKAKQCGWLKDKYGVSWQVVPIALVEMISDPDYEKSQRVMTAMLQMKKLDIAELKRAHAG